MSVLDLALLYHSVKIRRGTDKQLLIMILLYTSLFYFSVYLLTFFLQVNFFICTEMQHSVGFFSVYLFHKASIYSGYFKGFYMSKS